MNVSDRPSFVSIHATLPHKKQQVLIPVTLEGMDRLTCKYVPTDPTAKDAPTDTSKPETASFSTGIQVASGEKSRDFWFYGFDIGAGLF